MAGYFNLMLTQIAEDERKHWAAQISLRCDMAIQELSQLSERPPPLDDTVQKLKDVKFMASAFSWPSANVGADFWQVQDVPPKDSRGRRLNPGAAERCAHMRDALRAQFLQAIGVEKFHTYRVIDVASDHLMHIASMVQWDECAMIFVHMQQSLAFLDMESIVSGMDLGK
eukprot:s2906_g9.t1